MIEWLMSVDSASLIQTVIKELNRDSKESFEVGMYGGGGTNGQYVVV